MQGRFQRGGQHCISPFFAFQDIITSAIAILIVVVMLLALSISDPTQAARSGPESARLQQQLEAVLDDLDRTNAEVRRLQAAAAAHGSADPAVLKGTADALRRELATLSAQNRDRESQLQTLETNDVSLMTREEIGKKRAIVAARSKETAALLRKSAESLAEMNRLEALARAKEAQLLAEKAKKNQIWLIPEPSHGSKEPVLAVVSQNRITLQRFDHPEIERLGPDDFESALSHYSKLDQYIVFYIKPSGVRYFESLTRQAKRSGFDIGYDAVGEEMEIDFSSVQ